MNFNDNCKLKKYFTIKGLILITNIIICCFYPLNGSASVIEFTDTRIIWDGKNVTDLVDYVSYSRGYEKDKMYIIKKIDQQDPETIKKVRFFYNNRKHREVIDILFRSAIENAMNELRYRTEYLQKAQILINKGASVNSHDLLAKSLCLDKPITQFLIKHGAKLTDKNNEGLILRCMGTNDIDNLKYIEKHNKFKLIEQDNKNFNNTMNLGGAKDETVNIFLDNNGLVDSRGFYGLILHEYPIKTIQRVLNLNKTLLITPIYIKTYETSFKKPHGDWVSAPLYPLTVALDSTRTVKGEKLKLWYIANQKDCKVAPQCVQVVQDYKDRIQLLLDNGAIPRDMKEKSIIKKLGLIVHLR